MCVSVSWGWGVWSVTLRSLISTLAGWCCVASGRGGCKFQRGGGLLSVSSLVVFSSAGKFAPAPVWRSRICLPFLLCSAPRGSESELERHSLQSFLWLCRGEGGCLTFLFSNAITSEPTLPRFGCSRVSRLFLVDWVPGALSRRKRRPLLFSFRHSSGLGAVCCSCSRFTRGRCDVIWCRGHGC
jgi:hypothetical protein